MAHIELHDTLPDHPKLVRLARMMKRDRQTTLGHLITLWLWAIRYRPGGDLRGIDDGSLCEASGFSVRSVQWPCALRECGFVDGNPGELTLHDWTEYTRGYRKATADRTRIAKLRAGNVARQSHDSRGERRGEEQRGEEQIYHEPASPLGDGIGNDPPKIDDPADDAAPQPRFPAFKTWARDVWNPFALRNGLPQVNADAPQRGRESAWSARCRTPGWFASLSQVLERIPTSDFLSGKISPTNGRKRFQANVDWLMRQDSATKTLEGKYDNDPLAPTGGRGVGGAGEERWPTLNSPQCCDPESVGKPKVSIPPGYRLEDVVARIRARSDQPPDDPKFLTG